MKYNQSNETLLQNFKRIRQKTKTELRKAKKYLNNFDSCVGKPRHTYNSLKKFRGQTQTKIFKLWSCDSHIENITTKDIAKEPGECSTNIGFSVTQDLPMVTHVSGETVNYSRFLYRTKCSEIRLIIESLEANLRLVWMSCVMFFFEKTSIISGFLTGFINQFFSQRVF